MALFRVSRERKGHDPHTTIKIAIFSIGAVLALVGMALENTWIIYTAIGVLAIGVILRLVTARAERHQQDDLHRDDVDEPGDNDDASAPVEPRI